MAKKQMTAQEVEQHNAVVTDAELENGEHPIGKIVHFSTVTHAFRGVLEAVTPSYYVLRKGTVQLIALTGAMPEYTASEKSAGREVEEVRTRVLIPRGAVAWSLVYE